jgi:hypothetical protein
MGRPDAVTEEPRRLQVLAPEGRRGSRLATRDLFARPGMDPTDLQPTRIQPLERGNPRENSARAEQARERVLKAQPSRESASPCQARPHRGAS